MCFGGGGGGGPSESENKAAAEQRIAAEAEQEKAATEKAKAKREDISDAVKRKSESKYGRRGRGRRSLMQTTSGGGFLGRFE